MRNKAIASVLIITIFLCACGSKTVTKEEYEAAISAKEAAEQSLAQAEKERDEALASLEAVSEISVVETPSPIPTLTITPTKAPTPTLTIDSFNTVEFDGFSIAMPSSWIREDNSFFLRTKNSLPYTFYAGTDIPLDGMSIKAFGDTVVEDYLLDSESMKLSVTDSEELMISGQPAYSVLMTGKMSGANIEAQSFFIKKPSDGAISFSYIAYSLDNEYYDQFIDMFATLKWNDSNNKAGRLNSVVGEDVYTAHQLIKDLGYTPTYYDISWVNVDGKTYTVQESDFGTDKYPIDDLKECYFVTRIRNIDPEKKTVSLTIEFQWVDPAVSSSSNEQTSKPSTAKDSRPEINSAWVAVEEYGLSQYPYGFNVKLKFGAWDEIEYDDKTWLLKAQCEITNAFGAKRTSYFEAKVTGSTESPKVYDFYVY